MLSGAMTFSRWDCIAGDRQSRYAIEAIEAKTETRCTDGIAEQDA